MPHLLQNLAGGKDHDPEAPPGPRFQLAGVSYPPGRSEFLQQVLRTGRMFDWLPIEQPIYAMGVYRANDRG